MIETSLTAELAAVDDLLLSIMDSRVELLAQLWRRIVRSGGKRVRPAVAISAYQALGGVGMEPIAPLAAAVELLHTASLIHDDINDHGQTRRGQPTINSRFGSDIALLAGDYVFVKLLTLLTDVEPWARRIVSDGCQELVEGETLQALSCWNMDLTEEEYLEQVALKTSSLFGAAARLGAMAARGTPQQVDALAEYGRCLGIAFQIRDDIMDLQAISEGAITDEDNDLLQGKFSLGMLYALRTEPRMATALNARRLDDVRQLLVETDALGYATRRGQAHADQACAAIDRLPDNRGKANLQALAELAVNRDC